jgi:hypothetical protein
LFTLTYGALVRQVLHDCEDRVDAVNEKLDAMGFSIGCRLIEDFLSKTNTHKCGGFKETCEMVSKVGVRMFLNLNCTIENWNESETECHLVFEHLDPFAAFVDVPERFKAERLSYCQLLCGVVRGALESVGTRTECAFVKDPLLGKHGDAHGAFVMSLKFESFAEEAYPFED